MPTSQADSVHSSDSASASASAPASDEGRGGRPGPDVVRREYLLRGVVQGVGFRPHVAGVASRHPVAGFCGNDDACVFIEVQGTPVVLDAFAGDLLATLPPLARVVSVTHRDLPTLDEHGFRIVPSRHAPGARTLIPPDVATCDDCLADMADPENRRHRYAFTTCTNCGPRLTIIEDLPYDRPATTMRAFPMCPACAREYADPGDRRFHAQPISCYDCGPGLWLARPGQADAAARPSQRPASASEQEEIIAETIRRLLAGEIVAVKGLGGFHLMCDARNAGALARLRERKRRSGKPFAVMVADESAARRLARLTPEQCVALTSPARPIVIAPMASGYDLDAGVAPGLDDVGLMLPYTPLHALLLDGASTESKDDPGLALVATSGNLAEEPLCYTNADALARLAPLADSFLLHDRAIHVPVEDSVTLALPEGGVLPLRRSRGYAPLPVALPTPLPTPSGNGPGPVVLAVGGELKNTFTLAVGEFAFVSAHIGDMGSLASQQALEASVSQLIGIHRAEPEVVVHDLHPGYATTAWAQRYADAHAGVRLIGVQHHVAHALALLAEHEIGRGPVVVAALDGTGYGPDDTVWGGEILTLGSAENSSPWNWRRTWHVPHFGLVGGDRAVREPWRAAQGLAHSWALGVAGTPASSAAPPQALRLVESQLASGRGVVQTSSAGRLFDAASAMLGICLEARYEAQAAMELERSAARWQAGLGVDAGWPDAPGATGAPDGRAGREGVLREDALREGTLRDVFVDLLAHPERSVEERAWLFHQGVAAVFVEQLVAAASDAGTRIVGLTGGVVVNRIFTSALLRGLRARGLDVLTHQVVPPNDGGLSLGQAWAGRLATRSADAG